MYKALSVLTLAAVCGRVCGIIETTSGDELKYLKNDVVPYVQSLAGNVVKLPDGASYSLDMLEQYSLLFSDKYYKIDETDVIDTRTGDVVPVSVFRASYDDGTFIQAEKDSRGKIVYAEIRRGSSEPITVLVKGNETANEYLTFTEDDIDAEQLKSDFPYGFDVNLPDNEHRELEGLSSTAAESPREMQQFVYRRGDGSSSECRFFKVVDIAVVFDGEFCAMLGSFAKAERHIQMVVASASAYYENDMCVKLKLTNVVSPESVCRQNGVFRKFNRKLPCGRREGVSTFLDQFSSWARENRDRLRIDPDATVHMFTGFPRSGAVGCAWVGATCRKNWSFGVEFMKGASRLSQGIILAHEVGHGLNALHLPVTDKKDYIMEPYLGRARDGFSQSSIQSILRFLDRSSVKCDSVEIARATPRQTTRPTTRPTPRPTARPSPRPTRRPSPRPTLRPTARPSPRPTLRPSQGRTPLPTLHPSPRPSPRPTVAPRSPMPTRSPSASTKSTCEAQKRQVEPPCAWASNRGRYACYPRSLLLGVKLPASCQATKPTGASLLSCTNVQYKTDGSTRFRQLKKEKKAVVKDKAGSNDVGVMSGASLDRFNGDQCDESCVEVDDFVCVLATADDGLYRVYNMTYSVTAAPTTWTFSSYVLIVNEGDLSNDACVDATTKCHKSGKSLRI